ncbi:MAG: Zn-ribbon containing protein [Candidatus Nanoarchaeia archaeon]|nr:Zn-ribbon containing protein [Candidatus Nanoarchaeia archaeon]
MPHQCTRCGMLHQDGSAEILKGCACGSRFFFYIRKESLQQTQEIISNLTVEQKQEIEQDIVKVIGNRIEEDKPIVFDLESIRVNEPGIYELDLVKLFKKEPLIIRLEEGKYIINLDSTFLKK